MAKTTIEATLDVRYGKPGYKSSEFALTLGAQFVGFLMIAFPLSESLWLVGAGVALMLLTQLGYTAGRSKVKAEALKILQGEPTPGSDPA